MVDHPFRSAAAATNGVYEAELLEAGIKRTIVVLGPDEDLGDYEFSVGEIPLAIAWAATGYVYYYDSSDAVTADDGLTTLVTGNGLRYHAEDGASISLNAHLGVISEPVGDEIVGAVYRVDVAATGSFAGQDDNIAVLTRRGWVFATPEIGMAMLNRDTGQNEQFGEGGWGGYPVTFDAGSISPAALQFPAGIVVDDTLDTPPGAPSVGKYWIVGGSPTGAFSGHAGDLAYWTGSSWDFLDPQDGWGVYHKAGGFAVYYASGAWLGSTGSETQEFASSGSFTWTKPARGNMALIQAWGAGGSGGRGASSFGAGAGGGGAYIERMIPMAALASTITVTVGAGGSAITTNNTNGHAGGNSSFGSHVVAYGGGAGGYTLSGSGGGGGGGGQKSAGASASGSSAGGGGAPFASSLTHGGGNGGNGSPANNSPGSAGSESLYGGGAGGGGGIGSGNGGNGGASMWGGAGGGGGGNGPSTGGVSTYGGNGGAGADGSTAATAGAQPGGGGGASESGNSGKGGDGLVRVTVF